MKSAVLFACAALTGCGAFDPGGVPLLPDAGGDGDNGAVSTNYPAYQPDTGHIINNGGPVFSSMIIVTITWNGDSGQDLYDQFGDTIGASNYWRTINSEYGIGPATSGAANHVHLDPNAVAPPGNDSAARNFVQSGISNGTLPAPTDQTLYTIYIPPNVMFTGGCTQFGGYHGEITSAGHHYAYAIVMNCAGTGNATESSAHELNEAATDPYPQSNTAWVGFDDDHLAYELLLQEYDELGDACWDPGTGFYPFDDHEPGFAYFVQRQWSNAAAAGGHAPCVPALPTPYYGVAILPGQLDTISVNYRALGIASTKTKGLKVPLGTSRTFAVGFFSDRFTSNPWTLSVNVPAMLPGGTVKNGTAMVAIDKTAGKNGEKANITVTSMTFNSTGATYLELVSHLPGFETHTTPLLLGSQ